jgi:hypothetical protein
MLLEPVDLAHVICDSLYVKLVASGIEPVTWNCKPGQEGSIRG